MTIQLLNLTLHLEKQNYPVFDITQNKVRAERKPFPIKLAYVHKAQGQNLPNLIIDCAGFFAAGQLGVTLGRAVSKDGLQVRNYQSECAKKKHPPKVYQFYEKLSVPVSNDLSCCRTVIESPARVPEKPDASLPQERRAEISSNNASTVQVQSSNQESPNPQQEL